jgi:hypothetical protein
MGSVSRTSTLLLPGFSVLEVLGGLSNGSFYRENIEKI